MCKRILSSGSDIHPREAPGTHPQAVVLHHQNTGNSGEAALAPPKKYHTDEERREARLEGYRKYYKANREAITGRRKKAYKTKRAALKAAQEETLAGT
jgi:hypothetical protein